MRIRISLLLVWLPVLASCSFAFTHGAPSGLDMPEGPESVSLRPCDPNRTWGVIDMIFSLTSIGSGYVASIGTLDPDEDRGQYIMAGALVGAAFGLGAALGFKRADDCGDFRLAYPEYFPEFDPNAPVVAQGSGGVEIVEGNANLLTTTELAGYLDRTAFEAIQLLRGQWLRRTGFRNDFPAVIVDSQNFDLDYLESVRVDVIETISFVNPSDATVRWGVGYPSGVIEVHIRR